MQMGMIQERVSDDGWLEEKEGLIARLELMSRGKRMLSGA